MKILTTFKDFFKSKEIRDKILFTLVVMIVYKFGTMLSFFNIDTTYLRASLENNSLLGIMNMLSGGNLEHFSLFALGVGPYITASIVIQMMSMDVIPYLTQLKKEGGKGQRKLTKITRYFALILGFVQAYSMAYGFDKQYHLFTNPSVSKYLLTALIMSTGFMILLWLADKISQNGIGNGVSLVIFSGIVSQLPNQMISAYNSMADGSWKGIGMFASYLCLTLLIITLIVVMEKSERRIPVRYTGGVELKNENNVTYIPFKVNTASVMPVILAQAVLTAPQIVLSFVNRSLYNKVSQFLSFDKPSTLVLYGILIFIFAFVYVSLEINVEEMDENLSKNGGYVIGVRPGKETQQHISGILRRVTFFGAVGITLIALLPYVLTLITPLTLATAGGGTSLILVVGISLETIKNLKSRLTAKVNYGNLFRERRNVWL